MLIRNISQHKNTQRLSLFSVALIPIKSLMLSASAENIEDYTNWMLPSMYRFQQPPKWKSLVKSTYPIIYTTVFHVEAKHISCINIYYSTSETVCWQIANSLE